jgi:hypothetical protein
MNTLYATWLEGDDDAIREYMAALREMPGVVHTAVYKPGGKGPKMLQLGAGHTDLDLPLLVEHPPTAWALALLDCPAAGLTITEKLGPRAYRHVQYPGNVQEDFRTTEGPAKIVLAQVLLHEISYVPGVAETGDLVFADAVQFGVLSTRSVETEWTILDWYERYRLLAAESIPGLVRARRYVSIAGFATFGILYEFVSLQARLEGFEEPHEGRSLDPNDPWKLASFALHTPGAPFVGARVDL